MLYPISLVIDTEIQADSMKEAMEIAGKMNESVALKYLDFDRSGDYEEVVNVSVLDPESDRTEVINFP